jgi:hypothetical protein
MRLCKALRSNRVLNSPPNKHMQRARVLLAQRTGASVGPKATTGHL